jgi:phospholipase C
MRSVTRNLAILLALAAIPACRSGGGGGGGGASSAGATAGSSGGSTAGGGSGGSTGGSAAVTQFPVKYVFIIFKENHTFDNFFATFPGAEGATSGKTSTGATVPLTQPGTDVYLPGSNGWSTAHQAWDQGAMDQFDKAETAPYVTYAPTNGLPGGPANYYWEIAEQGVLCDHFHTAVMGPSFPNHLFSVAATSGRCIGNPPISVIISGGTPTVPVLDASGNVVQHPMEFTPAEIATTLPNELEAAGLTWYYYSESSANPLGQLADKLEDQGIGVSAIDVLKSTTSFATSYVETVQDFDVNWGNVLAAGNVGNVTWIRPGALNSEHPGLSGVQAGSQWTLKVINAIGASPYWDQCAIFITYDDYGGFYDHVAPPQLDDLGLGFRVPCTIVSPYAKKAFVYKDTTEVSSILKFCEVNFGLQPMTARDKNAADMTPAFDFTQAPRPFSDFYFTK